MASQNEGGPGLREALEDIGMIGPDSDPSVYNFFHSDFKGQYINFPRYSTDEMDQLLEKGRTSSDPAERNRTYNKVRERDPPGQPHDLHDLPKEHLLHEQQAEGLQNESCRMEYRLRGPPLGGVVVGKPVG